MRLYLLTKSPSSFIRSLQRVSNISLPLLLNGPSNYSSSVAAIASSFKPHTCLMSISLRFASKYLSPGTKYGEYGMVWKQFVQFCHCCDTGLCCGALSWWKRICFFFIEGCFFFFFVFPQYLYSIALIMLCNIHYCLFILSSQDTRRLLYHARSNMRKLLRS